MKKVDAYKFFNNLVEKYPEDSLPMLIDIIVDYLLFPKGDGSEQSGMTAMEIHLAELMSDPSKKIQAIKFVREQTGFGLAEAKDYVEQRVWPAGKGPLSEKALEMQSRFVQNIIDRISTDYKLN